MLWFVYISAGFPAGIRFHSSYPVRGGILKPNTKIGWQSDSVSRERSRMNELPIRFLSELTHDRAALHAFSALSAEEKERLAERALGLDDPVATRLLALSLSRQEFANEEG